MAELPCTPHYRHVLAADNGDTLQLVQWMRFGPCVVSVNGIESKRFTNRCKMHAKAHLVDLLWERSNARR